MRSDIALYVVAAFFFILTVVSAVIIAEEERTLWIVSTAVLGVLSVGLGYYQRPHTNITVQKVQTAAPTQPAPVAQTTIEAPAKIEQTPVIEAQPVIETPIMQPTNEVASPIIDAPTTPAPTEEPAISTPTETVAAEQTAESPLTKVKGVGAKRASQLNALGINTVEELAQASIEDISKNLKISPKIVAKWVEGAKQQ